MTDAPTMYDTSRDTNEVLGKLDTLTQAVSTGLASLKSEKQPEIVSLELDPNDTTRTTRYIAHTKFYMSSIVFSGHEILATAGTTFVLHVGSRLFRFHFDISNPFSILFPLVLDRGTDVYASFEDVSGAVKELTGAFVHLIGVTD